MTMRMLKKFAPAWTWTARRPGLGVGWTYDGRCGDRLVSIYAEWVCVGGDALVKRWRAAESDLPQRPYITSADAWLVAEDAVLPAAEPRR